MAIQLALRSPDICVEALTTVFGNCPVDITTRNALINLEQAGRADIPVARGASKALIREQLWPAVPGPHGRDCLGDCGWPAPRAKALDTPAAALITECILQSPGEITLLALAPLTNLALALSLEPRIVHHVREVVVMGGILNPAGDDPIAEFNFRCDPDAAAKVLDARWPMVMVGLDVTMTVAMTSEHVQELSRAGTHATEFLTQIIPVYFDWCRQGYHKDVLYPHDVCALAYVLDPSLFVTESVAVDVEVRDADSRGKTTEHLPRGGEPHVKVCRAADSERLLRMYIDCVTA
jgi:inosine-uridine nucleoside N-ribohydrolase